MNKYQGAVPPLLPAIPTFASIGIGRTKAYEILNAGTVPARKIGRSTMIRAEDWERFLDSLPAYRGDNARAAA